MSKKSQAEKQQQFDAFFSIQHAIDTNVILLPDSFEPPASEALKDNMPIAFRVASEMANLDSKALHALRNLSQHAEDLVDYLNHMSRKIDLMMSLLLQNQDDPTHQFKTYSFGGGGVTIIAESPMQIGQQAEVKLFLPQEAKAVFCYAEVLTCEAQGAHYKVALVYTSISEDDQELLIRASLHLQTQLLKQRAQHKPA